MALASEKDFAAPREALGSVLMLLDGVWERRRAAASVIMRPLIPTKLRVHDRSIINDVTRGHPNSLAILVGLIFWVVSFLWASSSLYQLVFDR